MGKVGAEDTYNIQRDGAEDAEDFTDGERDGADEELAREIQKPDEYALMRSAAAAGQQIWPCHDDFMFLFSSRYNSPMFRDGYLQAEYRAHVQETFTGLVDGIIDRKLARYKDNPFMYRKYTRRLTATRMQKDKVRARAAVFGIDVSKLDVGFLVHDVVAGLEGLTDTLLDDHPDLTPPGRRYAKRFLNGQLEDEREQTLWRFVTSDKLSDLYSYERIGESIPLIRGLDRMIHYQFPEHPGGEIPYRDPSKTYMADILGDDVIDECFDLMDGGDYDGMPADWAVADAISRVEQPAPGW